MDNSQKKLLVYGGIAVGAGLLIWYLLNKAKKGGGLGKEIVRAFYGDLPGDIVPLESGNFLSFPAQPKSNDALAGKIITTHNETLANSVEFAIMNPTGRAQEYSAYIDWFTVNVGIPPWTSTNSGLVKGNLPAGYWQSFKATVSGSIDLLNVGRAKLILNGKEADSV